MFRDLPAHLSATQKAAWLEQQFFPGKPIFTIGQRVTIPGPLQPDLFAAALRATITESPGLRLTPDAAPPPLDLQEHDLRGTEDPDARATAWMLAALAAPFDLADPTLYRFALLRVADDRTIWFQAYHHIIIDGVGMARLTARTASRYRTLRFGIPLPDLRAASPGDLAAAEAAYAASPAYTKDQDYWLERLNPPPPPLVEKDRHSSARGRSGITELRDIVLPRPAMERFTAQAKALGATTAGAFLTVTYCAFARLYGRSDMVIGTSLANRSGPGADEMIGARMQHMAFRLALDPAIPVGETLLAVERLRRRDYRHRRFPIRDLGSALGLLRQGRSWLFDALVNYLPVHHNFGFEAGPVDMATLTAGFGTPWMATLADTGSGRDAILSIETDSGLIDTAEATRFASCLETLLLHGLEDPTLPLSRLPILAPGAKEQLIALAAGPHAAPLPGETMVSLCAAQAERTPEAEALVCGTERLNFATLHSRAARLARRLAALGIGPGVPVGLALPRQPDLIVAVLAIHKAGGAYLPLDPAYPAERIRFIVEDSKAPLILTTASLAADFADSGARLLLLDAEATHPAEAEPVPPQPGDLAYVLYTSGSTGRPKGVGIEHRSVVNLIRWGVEVIDASEREGVLLSTSLNFDISVFEVFLPLACGGRIILVENLLVARGAPAWPEIRFINTGPSVLDALLRTGGLPPRTGTIILVGEALPRDLADRIFAVAPGVRLLNCYGPTETTVFSSWARVRPEDRSEPTIGRPLLNTTLHVLDAGGELLPPGAIGELYIGGEGVGRGYLGRQEITQARFVQDAFGPDTLNCGRLYRTGDRVRWQEDDELEFLGRADDQIKLNGVRIEPGEIEAAIRALEGIDATVVMLRKDAAGTQRLVGYVVASPGTQRDSASLRDTLERSLPSHLMPAAFVWLDALPMTPNGKIDRKALPEPRTELDGGAVDRPPVTPLERELAGIWEEVLQVPVRATGTDFFDLGGDSLALLNLFAEIEARYGRHLTFETLAGGLTVRRLAQLLAGAQPAGGREVRIVNLQPRGEKSPFFCVHSIGGHVMNLRHLASHMPKDRPFLGLRWIQEDGVGDSIEQIATRYVAAVLDRQPTGPFYLGGYSMGAVIAYEMARQLVERGHQVGLLAVIDTRWRNWRLTWRNVLPTAAAWVANLPHYVRHEAATFDAEKLRGKFRRAWRRVRRLAGGQHSDLAVLLDLEKLDAQWHPLFQAHVRAYKDYQPLPCRLPIAVLRAHVQPFYWPCDERSLGWSAVADEQPEVYDVPGNHVTITDAERAQFLAEALSRALQGGALSNGNDCTVGGMNRERWCTITFPY